MLPHMFQPPYLEICPSKLEYEHDAATNMYYVRQITNKIVIGRFGYLHTYQFEQFAMFVFLN